MNKKTTTLKNNLYMLKLIWDISPKIIIYSFFYHTFNFAIWAFETVVLTKYLFGAAEFNRTFQQTVLFLTSYIGILFFAILFASWYNLRYLPKIEQKIHFHLNRMLFEKASNVDISCYENPNFYDNYTKATTETFTRAMSVIKNISSLFGSFFSSVFVIASMFSINKIAGFFSFMPIIGSLIFGKFINKLYYKKNKDDIPYQRRQEYVNRTVYLTKYAKEIRLSNIFSVLKDTYEEGYNGIIRNINTYRKRIFWLEDIRNALCFPVVFEGTWLFAAYCAIVAKSILIGDFVVLARSIVSTTWMLQAFTDSLNQSYQNGLYINNLKSFLYYEEKIPENQQGEPVPEIIKTLELSHVTFCYDGTQETVLDNICMKVNAGEKISLVGHNGAGKSTLIKLIMRLYEPTSGKILLNGKDIRSFHLKSYRSLIGTTFQDFQMLSMTIAENVLMQKVTTNEQRQKAIQALTLSGIEKQIKKLPNGVDTILTREFDDNGVVLSGGQFQKIAVARAFANDCPIVLLDEPSSALDPVAEYQMYETIMQLSNSLAKGQKRLSIVISHRLSSAVMADRIYMLESGKIIEYGTHRQLMYKAGVYADMFKKQAENYLQKIEV